MLITIHARHIREGSRNDCGSCPVALALREALAPATVRVDLEMIVVDGQAYETPEHVADWMNRFDFTTSRDSMRPVRFEWPLPLYS